MFTNDMTSITSVIGQTEYWRNICQIMAGSTFKFSVACYVLFACIRLLFYIRLWKCNFASFFHSLFCCPFDYSVGSTFSAVFCVKLPRYLKSQNSPLLSCNAMSSGNNFPKFWSILLFLWSRCKEMETESFSKLSKPHEVTCQKIFTFVALALPDPRVLIFLNTSHYCY